MGDGVFIYFYFICFFFLGGGRDMDWVRFVIGFLVRAAKYINKKFLTIL
jgi:hypothetical protein